MKKLLTTIALSAIFTNSAFADEPIKPESAPQSVLALSVFDVSNKAPKDLKTTTISRSAKQQLCWVAQGEFNRNVKITESFTSPDKATFQVEKELGMATSSTDKKTHTVTTQKDAINEGKNVVSCWNFDKNDPLGNYTIKVQVDNIQYSPLSFTVVK